MILYFAILFFIILNFNSVAYSFNLSFALFLDSQDPKSIYLSLEDKKSRNDPEKLKNVKEKEKSKSGSIGKYIEEIKNPSEEYDTFMKKLLKGFFTGYGLRILVFFCVAMMIFFFFRTRNLFLVMIFYILGNLIMFFGHLIAKYIIK